MEKSGLTKERLFDYIHTIRYMGNKSKLLNFIIPEIEKITKTNDTICDIMAGTSCIGYALKKRNKIIANDCQFYSYVISNALLQNYVIPKTKTIKKLIEKNYFKNIEQAYFSFFVDNYTDTYFSKKQCQEIDSLRYAISLIEDKQIYFLCLCLLMSAMCTAQSTTGHFAEFLNHNNKRTIPLRQISINELFYKKLDDFKDFVISSHENKCYCLDYKILFKNINNVNISCFYLDSPYTNDQYSRFYHVLETICKYDSPTLTHKALYRSDRIKSNFCFKNKVAEEFQFILSYVSKKKSSLVISYSDKGLITIDNLIKICKKYYKVVEFKRMNYVYSSQGKGPKQANEVLLIMKACDIR